MSRSKTTPLYRQIMDDYIQKIQTGALLPGEKLPPERTIAKERQVNRSTVVRALDELASLGWITRKQGSGTQVTQGQLGNRQAPFTNWPQWHPSSFIKEDPYLRKMKEIAQNSATINLYSGDLPTRFIPDFAFPSMSWEQIRSHSTQNQPFGYAPLVQLLSKHLYEQFQFSFDTQQLMITSGSTQGIQLILQTLVDKGDFVATEDPSFLFALPYFSSLGVQLIGVAQDEEGLIAHEFAKLCQTKKIRLLYLNPTHQNPTGRTMSLQRRKQIIDICQRHHIPIIEDDVFAELNFQKVPPKLKELAPEQVIYLGSFSKIFTPLIKIGWIVAPRALSKAFVETKQQLDLQTDIFTQLIAYHALNDPHYQTNHQQLIQAIKQTDHYFQQLYAAIQKDWHTDSIDGGIYRWLTWRHRPLKRKDWELFLTHNILLAPSFLFSNDTIACRINYTHVTTEQLSDLIERFTRISQELRKDV